MAIDSICFNRLASFKFVGDTLSVSALICLVTLTFNPNLVRVIARGVDNIPSNFGVSGGTFRSRVSTFNLGAHGACQ